MHYLCSLQLKWYTICAQKSSNKYTKCVRNSSALFVHFATCICALKVYNYKYKECENMTKFSDRLKELRKSKELSQADFAKQLGLSKSSINMYERGEREPSINTLEAIADYFNVDMDYLLGKTDHRNRYEWLKTTKNISAENIIPIPKMKKIPLLGKIACGEPILATENLDGFVNAPEDITADFALTCRGESMIGARILDGDIVLIRQQPDVDDGEIAAVLIENEATLKRVHKKNGCLILNPANPNYEPIVITGEELAEVRILGKAVYFISAVK